MQKKNSNSTLHFLTSLFILGFFFLAASFPAYAQKTFNAQEATLDNGLKIVVVENHRVPVATQMIWYKIGAADELPGKSGIVHFLEHLMFKGHSYPSLGSYKPGEFSRIVRSVGGQDNAFTGQDYTAYYQSVSTDHLEEMMRIEAARMRGLSVPEEEVTSENKVICEERRQRTDNNPQAQLAEQMGQSLFPVHPYGIPVIGWMKEMETLSWDDAKHFYDRYYTPNNAILVVSGDVTLPQVVDMAKRTYGLLPAGESVPERNRKAAAEPLKPIAPIIMHHENVRQPLFQRLYRVPGYRQSPKTSLAFDVLERILGAPSTGRLYKSLVVDKKLAANIGFNYNGTTWDDGTVSISASPVSEEAIAPLRQGIDAILQDIVKNGPTQQEVSDAIIQLKSSAIYARDDLSAPAMIIGMNMVTGTPLEDIEGWPDLITQVTPSDIQTAAQKHLNPEAPTSTPPVEGILLEQASTDTQNPQEKGEEE